MPLWVYCLGAAVIVTALLLFAWALCRAAAAGDRALPHEREDDR